MHWSWYFLKFIRPFYIRWNWLLLVECRMANAQGLMPFLQSFIRVLFFLIKINSLFDMWCLRNPTAPVSSLTLYFRFPLFLKIKILLSSVSELMPINTASLDYLLTLLPFKPSFHRFKYLGIYMYVTVFQIYLTTILYCCLSLAQDFNNWSPSCIPDSYRVNCIECVPNICCTWWLDFYFSLGNFKKKKIYKGKTIGWSDSS